MATYKIEYSNGRQDTADDYSAAQEIICAEYPDAVTDHDGDLSSGGDRTLCWADEKSSIDDDGQHAVASIYRIADCGHPYPICSDRRCEEP